jgi:hypothetical protein
MDLVRLLPKRVNKRGQMNKIESQAKNLEPEKEHIIKAFNSGRLGRNKWIKQQKNISTKP